jgi:uncharacterized lipoprotein YddW (UPF0748 family)
MRTSRTRVAIVAAALAATSVIAARGQAPSQNAPQVRGLWVPRTALVSQAGIAAMVRAAQSGGFNALLVQVRGRGEAFYRSDIEPRATDLDRQPADFDPLATTIELANQAGLAVHAWVNVNLVASGTTLPRSREHVAVLHPDWLMLPKALAAPLRTTTAWSPGYLGALSRWTRGASEHVEGLYISPVSAAARAYTASVVAELATRYALDGIHLDYIRYPNAEFDFSRTALAEFRQLMLGLVTRGDAERVDRLVAADPTAWAGAHPAEWSAFHRDRLTSLVIAVQKAARTARPGLLVSAAVVGVAGEAREQRFQDWVLWAKAGYVDVPCPMLYMATLDQFGSLVSTIHDALGSVPFWAGIGAYRLPLDATIDRVRAARRGNAAGVVLFSYGQLVESGAASADALTALRPVLLESTIGTGVPR